MKCIAPHLLATMLVVMASTISHGQELTEGDLIGEWILPENGSVIRAHRCGDRFCGSDIEVKPPMRWDNSPRRMLPGILVPSNLRKTGRTTWRGELYNIRNGDTHEGTIKLIDSNRLNFVRCIIDSVLCETLTFHRIDPPSPKKPEKREHRAVSADQLEAKAMPLPKAKTKTTTKTTSHQPTRADFEAFFKEYNITNVPGLTAQEKQALFREFMVWRSQR